MKRGYKWLGCVVILALVTTRITPLAHGAWLEDVIAKRIAAATGREANIGHIGIRPGRLDLKEASIESTHLGLEREGDRGTWKLGEHDEKRPS